MTTFPEQIQTFPTMQNIDSGDLANVIAYQTAMENGDFATAAEKLALITNGENKVITAQLLNTIIDTCKALQEYFAERYSPAVIVSPTEPVGQELGDFWFKS